MTDNLRFGWFGKLAGAGDFASRRLSRSFIDPWDDWLSNRLLAFKADRAEEWLDLYLTSPLWRFWLPAGYLAGSQAAYLGLLMPSVDRVGRYFPLTVALEIGDARQAASAEQTLGPAQLGSALENLLTRIEQPMLTSLTRNWAVPEFDEALLSLPAPDWPGPDAGSPSHTAQARALWWSGSPEQPRERLLRYFDGALPDADTLWG